VFEAVRAIHDVPIEGAMPALAALARQRRFPDQAGGRVINANFRLGTAEAALALAGLAADLEVPDSTRLAALAALEDWHRNTRRDRVLGQWRPLPARDGQLAADALKPVLGWLLKQGSGPVAAAATRAAGSLGVPPPTEELLDFFRNAKVDARLRADALASLARDPGPTFQAAVSVALLSADEPFRRQGVRLIPRAGLADPLGRLKPLAAEGPVRIRQAAVAALGELTGPEADSALTDLLEAAAAGKAPAAFHLDLLEAAATKKDAALARAADRLRALRPAGDPLAPWWETLEGGDAEAGRKIFFENHNAGCLRCHKIKGAGGEVGPPLDGIGGKQPRRYLLESLMLPNAVIAKGYDLTTLHLESGAVAIGRVEAETGGEVRLVLPDGKRARFKTSEIAARSGSPSAMPEGLAKVLSPREIRDLVEYLAGLREP
jgi:quinoprotein glucose dehydrogenase